MSDFASVLANCKRNPRECCFLQEDAPLCDAAKDARAVTVHLTHAMIKAAWRVMVPVFTPPMRGVTVDSPKPGFTEALKAALAAGGYKVTGP